MSILTRIIKKSGMPELIDALVSRLSLSDLQSLLLAVYKKRVESRNVTEVLGQYKNNRFVKVAQVNPVEINDFDSMAFNLLPEGFTAVELSPVCPLGSCSVLGPVDQNNVITTIRNTEVLSDPTNAMALECAVRLRSRISGC